MDVFVKSFKYGIMAGLPWAGFQLGPQRPGQGILAEEYITHVTHRLKNHALPRLYPSRAAWLCYLFPDVCPYLPAVCLCPSHLYVIAITPQEPSALSPEPLPKYCFPGRLSRGTQAVCPLRSRSPTFFSALGSPHLTSSCISHTTVPPRMTQPVSHPARSPVVLLHWRGPSLF